MKFPNWFKISWWVLLLVALSTFLYLRLPSLSAGEAVPADIVAFLVWIGIALAPIFSEVDLFGLRLKQQINEIKENISSLRLTLSQNQNQSVTFQIQSPGDIAAKRVIEAQESPRSNAMKHQLQFIAKGGKSPSQAFEELVLEAIRTRRSPIPFDHLNEQIKLTLADRTYFYDAVATTSDIAYIIEIKFALEPSVVLSAVDTLEKQLYAYTYYRLQKMAFASFQLPSIVGDKVREKLATFELEGVPILIIPDGVDVPKLATTKVPILLFNVETGEFANAEEFSARVTKWRESRSFRLS